MKPSLCLQLMFSLQVLVAGFDTKLKPSLTNCSIRSTRLQENMYSMIHSVTLQWSMSQDILKEVDGYYWYCKCKDYKTAPTKIDMIPCTSIQCLPMQYSFDLSVDTCMDNCKCQVYPKPREGELSVKYWSNKCRFSIGPSVPVIPPNVSQQMIKTNENQSIQVFFKLPPLAECYCDDDIVTSVSVKVVYNSSKFMNIHISGDNINKINNTYKFTMQLDNIYFWNTINLSISVNNSVGASPYSDYYTIKGAINSDIPPGSYQLIYENLTSVSVLFYWHLTDLLTKMLESGFITGSQYSLTFLNGTVVNSYIDDNINFTLSSLNPGQWYLICVSLSTTDNSSWPPKSSCLNFKTEQDENSLEGTYEDDNGDGKSIVWMVLPILGCVVVVSVISVLCLKPYCYKEHGTKEALGITVPMSLHDTTISKLEPSEVEPLEDIATYESIEDITTDDNQDNTSSLKEPNNNALPDI